MYVISSISSIIIKLMLRMLSRLVSRVIFLFQVKDSLTLATIY
jgi:hypothetical protein